MVKGEGIVDGPQLSLPVQQTVSRLAIGIVGDDIKSRQPLQILGIGWIVLYGEKVGILLGIDKELN